MAPENETNTIKIETDSKPAETNTESVEKIEEIEGEWLIRECADYKDEYSECISLRGRFHQYFIYGDFIDCNQWKKDHNNCCKWIDDKDIKAGEAVISSERERMHIRLRGHYGNKIWETRESPPEDWSKPLPEWMVKRDENTYLAIKAKEVKEGIEEEKSSSCCIM